MISIHLEKRLLQVFVAFGCVVPVLGGLHGVIHGGGIIAVAQLDNHYRYLSGLLLGIGICFVSCIPQIERKSARFQLLTCIIVIGGVGRLYGVVAAGLPGKPMMLALAMELAVTPLLCVWQGRVAKKLSPFQ